MAAAAEVSAAVVVQLLPEAQPLVPAPVPEEPVLPAGARLVLVLVPVLAQLQVVVGLAGLPVRAHLVVEPEVLLHLRSRQSFSAAMARSSR